jgi:hypothetical protein
MVRSYVLGDGFIDAFDTWNPIVAAPLLRMQLDNLVRLSFMVRAPSASDVARHVVLGGEFRKLRDSDGKLLNDARLLEDAKEFHPWIPAVYRATSGWVHFSPAHVYAAVRMARDEQRKDDRHHQHDDSLTARADTTQCTRRTDRGDDQSHGGDFCVRRDVGATEGPPTRRGWRATHVPGMSSRLPRDAGHGSVQDLLSLS